MPIKFKKLTILKHWRCFLSFFMQLPSFKPFAKILCELPMKCLQRELPSKNHPPSAVKDCMRIGTRCPREQTRTPRQRNYLVWLRAVKYPRPPKNYRVRSTTAVLIYAPHFVATATNTPSKIFSSNNSQSIRNMWNHSQVRQHSFSINPKQSKMSLMIWINA